MTKTIFDRVPGTLSTLVNEQYTTFNVELDIVVKQLVAREGIADEAIAEVSLSSNSRVPDGGPYTLRYSYHGKRYESTGVRVNMGMLLASGLR